MRTSLEKYEGKKIRVMGEMYEKRYIKKLGEFKFVYVLQNIYMVDGEYLTDHILIEPCKKMKRMKIKKGRKVEFNAVVKKYSKMSKESKNREIPVVFNTFDWGLFNVSEPRKVE